MAVDDQVRRVKAFNPTLPVSEVSEALLSLAKSKDTHFGAGRIAKQIGRPIASVLPVLQAFAAEGLLGLQWVFYDEHDTPFPLTPRDVADALAAGAFEHKGRQVADFRQAISLYFFPTEAVVEAAAKRKKDKQ